MSGLIFIVSLLITYGYFSQTTISVTPLISYKLHANGYNIDEFFGFNIETKNIEQQNPYYNFDVKRISGRPAIDIGLRVQAAFDNNKHLLSLEWSQDAMGTMSKTSSIGTTNYQGYTGTLPSYNIYVSSVDYFHTGFTFSRFSLQYGRRLTDKLPIIQPYLVSDFSVGFGYGNRKDWLYENWPENTSVYYHNNARWVSTEIRSQCWGGYSFFMGLGLKGDLMLPLRKKSFYIFTLETTFRQGFKRMGYSSHKTVIDDGGTLLAFSNSITSRGSGFYFQISRNIQIHPWKKKNKEK